MDDMKFEVSTIKDADRDDPGENRALAYADIRGYVEDGPQKDRVTICRIWLLKEMNVLTYVYLVDWRLKKYQHDEQVKGLVKEAKQELIQHKKDMVENIFRKAYERYKLEWMAGHGHTLEELFGILQQSISSGEYANITDAFKGFEEGSGFGDELWPDKAQFKDIVWKDRNAMYRLLSDGDFRIWKSLW